MASRADRYAEVLYQTALEAWLDALVAADQALRSRYQDLITASFEEAQKILLEALPADLPKGVRNFLLHLLVEGEIGLLPQVVEAFSRQLRKEEMEVAVVTTAVELDEATREKVEAQLRARYGEKVKVVFQVDPKLLGGMVVRVGDRLLDGSLATRLRALREQLLSA